EGIALVRRHIGLDPRLARLLAPLVQAVGRVMDVAVEKASVVGEEHDLADGRAGAFRHHAIDHAFAFRHPGAWKSHLARVSSSRRASGILTANCGPKCNENR